MTILLRAAVLVGLLTAGFAPASPVDASTRAGTWLYSGEELLDALKGNAAYTFRDEAIRREAAAQTAAAYVAGVADASGRDVWCGQGLVKPHELVARVFAHLDALPAAARRGNAADLVRAALTATAPCEAAAS
ncbi:MULTISPECIES: Rap1a/Tai family immunity protein [Luteimonas]|uniref:Rap1a/Tai family immunity protein n=1 Tax=Luteimonas TaxID=83614 RepID=UPI000C7AC1DA|nr:MULTISPECIES: Rap1a/Tai family immunity protein [Luteimonas]